MRKTCFQRQTRFLVGSLILHLVRAEAGLAAEHPTKKSDSKQNRLSLNVLADPSGKRQQEFSAFEFKSAVIFIQPAKDFIPHLDAAGEPKGGGISTASGLLLNKSKPGKLIKLSGKTRCCGSTCKCGTSTELKSPDQHYVFLDEDGNDDQNLKVAGKTDLPMKTLSSSPHLVCYTNRRIIELTQDQAGTSVSYRSRDFKPRSSSSSDISVENGKQIPYPEGYAWQFETSGYTYTLSVNTSKPEGRVTVKFKDKVHQEENCVALRSDLNVE